MITWFLVIYASVKFVRGVRQKDKKALKDARTAILLAVFLQLLAFLLIY